MTEETLKRAEQIKEQCLKLNTYIDKLESAKSKADSFKIVNSDNDVIVSKSIEYPGVKENMNRFINELLHEAKMKRLALNFEFSNLK